MATSVVPFELRNPELAHLAEHADDQEHVTDLTLLAGRAAAAAVMVGMVMDQAIQLHADPPELERVTFWLSEWATKVHDDAVALGSPPTAEPAGIRRELRPALGWLGC
jgi:hypothetical protein